MPPNGFKSKSMFATMCKKAGLILKNGEENNEISVDKAIFQKNVSIALKREQGDLSEATEEFLEGFSTYISETQRFHKSLLPTMTTKDCHSARSKVQDSVVRMLLGVESLQTSLAKSLLEKLPEFSQDDGEGEGANLPRLLLAQFRWMDFIVDSKSLTSLLVELIEATELHVQMEIISALPSMVDDSDHPVVAAKLKDLLVSETQLTVVILDALAWLDLTPEVMTQVRGSATRALQSVDAENLPIVIKFLLKTAGTAELQEVIGEIRNGLDLYALVRSAKASSKGKGSNRTTTVSEESQDCVLLIVDALQSGIQYQRGIADAWLKVLNVSDDKLRVLDWVVLLMLLQSKQRKAVESLARNKIRSGVLTETLLQTAFTSHSQVMESRFKAVLSLAEVLLKSPEVSLSYMGHVLYRLAFRSLSTYCRQEIVASLVMQLGSGQSEESHASLDVLSSLVEHHLTAMAPFAIFFKRLLDFQQQSLSLLGMRKLFGMLAKLAFSASEDIALIQDDLHMVIRKLVSSMDTKCLCRGVVGGVMMVLGMGSDSGQGMSEARQKEVVSLLTMIRSGSSRCSEAAALFLDELAIMVSHANLHTKVETWILDNMTDMFQENFVVDIEDEKTSVHGIPMTPQYCLNDKEESSIVINLLPQVAQELMEPKAAACAVAGSQNMVYSVCLSPHFRLVQTGERRMQNGNMGGIDALLGCPLYMPEESVYTKLDALSDREKDVLCTTLFHCLNWFREVVNAFASQTDTEMKGKVIERLHDITQLSQVLARCLSAYPKYSTSLLGLGGEDVKPAVAVGTSKGKAAGEKKRGRKRKHADKENESTQPEGDSTQDVTTESQKGTQDEGEEEGGKVTAEVTDLSAFAHCFRELDLEVFTILHSGSITQASLDTDLHTTHARQVQIQTPQLQLLVEDLVKKLNHALIATATKRRSFPGKVKSGGKPSFSRLDQHKPQQVAQFMVDLLPALCTHLEATSAFFQTLMADNDGVVDGPGTHTPEALRMAACLHVLLHAFIAFFSWNGFGLSENRQLLKDSLGVLVGRVKVTGPSQVSMADLIKGSYQYVEKFSDTVPSLVCATSLVRLLTVLASRAEDPSLNHRLAELAHKLLQREWLDSNGQREKGAACNEMLQTLLKTFVSNSADPAQAMQTLADTGMTQLLQTTGQASTTYPTLTRSSFPVFLRVVMSELVGTVKPLPSLKKNDSRKVQEDCLLGWSVGVRVLFMAVGMAKELNSRAGIAACLKYGRQFVEVFLLRGMPVLDATFTSHSADVHSILRSLQQSTRILQNMCTHVKRVQDVSQVNQVPGLKRALERLVLRVKTMLSVNHCQRAFWMGNLKNKTLKGEEILSQAQSQESSTTTNDNNDDDDETMPDDDDDSEVEMDSTGNDGSDESGGEGGSISDTY